MLRPDLLELDLEARPALGQRERDRRCRRPGCRPSRSAGSGRLACARFGGHRACVGPSTTSVPRLTSGMHSLPTQDGVVLARGVLAVGEAVAVVVLAVGADLRRRDRCRSTASPSSRRAGPGTTRRSPSRRRPPAPGTSASPWRSSAALTQSTGLRSQLWLAPARKRPTTCALPGACVKSSADVGGGVELEPPDAADAAGRRAGRVAGGRAASCRWCARRWRRAARWCRSRRRACRTTARQPGNVVHCGSAQSTRLSLLSSTPLSQISVPIVGLQARLPMQSGSAQSMRPSSSSSRLLLQISWPGGAQRVSPKQPGSWQSARLLQLSSTPLLQISGVAVHAIAPPVPPRAAVPPPRRRAAGPAAPPPVPPAAAPPRPAVPPPSPPTARRRRRRPAAPPPRRRATGCRRCRRGPPMLPPMPPPTASRPRRRRRDRRRRRQSSVAAGAIAVARAEQIAAAARAAGTDQRRANAGNKELTATHAGHSCRAAVYMHEVPVRCRNGELMEPLRHRRTPPPAQLIAGGPGRRRRGGRRRDGPRPRGAAGLGRRCRSRSGRACLRRFARALRDDATLLDTLSPRAASPATRRRASSSSTRSS